MAKKKESSKKESIKKTSAKKSTPKTKNCTKKSCTKNCELKTDAQKKCGGTLPEMTSKEIELKPQSKSDYFFGLLKKVFGYESNN
jgi:hypothetical protein